MILIYFIRNEKKLFKKPLQFLVDELKRHLKIS